jgi:hypothetical protein
MYIKMYNTEPNIRSTMVVRKTREEGFDIFMPLLYSGTCIPYKNP